MTRSRPEASNDTTRRQVELRVARSVRTCGPARLSRSSRTTFSAYSGEHPLQLAILRVRLDTRVERVDDVEVASQRPGNTLRTVELLRPTTFGADAEEHLAFGGEHADRTARTHVHAIANDLDVARTGDPPRTEQRAFAVEDEDVVSAQIGNVDLADLRPPKWPLGLMSGVSSESPMHVSKRPVRSRIPSLARSAIVGPDDSIGTERDICRRIQALGPAQVPNRRSSEPSAYPRIRCRCRSCSALGGDATRQMKPPTATSRRRSRTKMATSAAI